ncbi:MAG: prenyltransferase [Candidatus Marinimicrobia bacterium]|nr:prenyltransferase [Candidatus Neomarinimicrobiota bacterium]
MKYGTWNDWVQASRPPFYIATLIPLTMGFVLAGNEGIWQPVRFAIVNLGAFLVHLATNVSNDYFDHLQGSDSGSSIGGSRVIQENKISPEALLSSIVLMYTAAAAIAIYLTSSLNLWGLWWIISFAFLSSLFYVAPPIRYGYRGLGELFVGLNMGPVMVLGSYWVMTGTPNIEAVWISIPAGVMVAFILYYQSLPDMLTDETAGKRTLAVRLGKRGAYNGLIVFGVAIYSVIVAEYFTGRFSMVILLSFITLPLFIKILSLAKRTSDWVELDQHGIYVRLFYLINGVILILAIGK